MKTGYFARATERKHRAYHTRVHILDHNEKCLCGYSPHKTMKFQFCANGIVIDYVECDKCKNIALKEQVDKYELALRQATGNYKDSLNVLIHKIEIGRYK